MTKEEFLKKLEKKLYILTENERKDIIDEYSTHIDEKIKNGKTIEEAIEDFGNMDDLIKEILSAYNINDKYANNGFESTITSLFDRFMKFISNSFNKLSNKLENNNIEFTFETFIKLIFELLVILILICIMKLPFQLVKEIGASLLGIFGYPLNKILIFAWKLGIEILYFISSIFIIYTIIKNRYFKDNHSVDIEQNSAKKKNEKKMNTNNSKIKEEKKVIVSQKENIFLTAFKFIFSIFLIIFSMPFVFSLIGLCICLGLLIAFVFQGASYYGFIILTLGLLCLNGLALDFIYRIIITRKRKGIYLLISIISSFILIGVGGVLSVNDVMNMEVVPSSLYTDTKDRVEYNIDNSNLIYIENYYDYEVITNDELENKVLIETKHYDEFTNLITYKDANNNLHIETRYIESSNSKFNKVKKIYKEFIKGIKNKKIINYTDLYEYKITIYVDSEYKNNIIFE